MSSYLRLNCQFTSLVDYRVCVGRYVADATVWLAIACILATLNVAKAKGEHGNEVEVLGNMSDSFFW